MSIDLDRKRLAQEDPLKSLLRKMRLTEMVTMHQWIKKEGSHEYAIYCALMPSRQIERALSDPAEWDLHFYQGTPTAVVGGGQVRYLRYGDDNGIEPLIINRDFTESQTNYGKRAVYCEISEEFRLFHNLYHDREKDEYIKIDDEGNEHQVIVVEPNHLQIRLKEIREFLAIKEMYLSIQFRYYEFSEYSLKALGTSEDEVKTGRETTAEGEICWKHSYYTEIHEAERGYSVLEGKRLIEPLPKSKSGFLGFAEEPKKKYVEFIIGVDEHGEEIRHTCDPTKLNRYGNNPGAIYDITPVHFHKQVLEKYYRESSKYSVEDSLVSCPWWSMRIDNHHDDKVIVWLRELCFLSHTEQHHWRAHNIPPEGGLSKTYFERNVKGLFTDSDRPEHLFKQRYGHLQKESEKSLGWQLLRQLGHRDEHHLKGLRIPYADEQRDFDELVLSLTKILIDSLNQKELKKLISLEQEQNLTPDQKENLKGIGWLEIALNSCGVEDAAEHITFLRKLQSLRSSGSAHLKGSKYQKIAKDFGIESQSLQEVFAGILSKALEVLDYFIFLIQSRQINREIIEQNNRERGYAILGKMIGFAESDSTDGSINHDEVIYELDSKP